MANQTKLQILISAKDEASAAPAAWIAASGTGSSGDE